MSLVVLGLSEIIESEGEEATVALLRTFITPPNFKSGEQNDVEEFLHFKAIEFENIGLSSTYLIFSTYQGVNIIVGYFSIANKPLIVNSRLYNSLSKNYQRRFRNIGFKNPTQGKGSDFIIPSYLIGQVGKNYSSEARAAKAINGEDIVRLAEIQILKAIKIINGKYCWLECLDEPKLTEFYVKKCGYNLVKDYLSSNNLRLLIKKIA